MQQEFALLGSLQNSAASVTSPSDKVMSRNSYPRQLCTLKLEETALRPFGNFLASPSWEFSVPAVLSQVANFIAKHVGFSEVEQTTLTSLSERNDQSPVIPSREALSWCPLGYPISPRANEQKYFLLEQTQNICIKNKIGGRYTLAHVGS